MPLSFDENSILGSLSASEIERSRPHLAPISLHRRDVLFEAHTPTKAVDFSARGVVSMILISQGGVEIEVGVIGREGIVNPSGGLAGNQAVARAMVQISGEGGTLAKPALIDRIRVFPVPF